MEYLRGCFGMIVANGTGVVNVFCEECKTFHFLKRLTKGAIPTGSGMIIRSAVYPINSCALDISGIARLSNIENWGKWQGLAKQHSWESMEGDYNTTTEADRTHPPRNESAAYVDTNRRILCPLDRRIPSLF